MHSGKPPAPWRRDRRRRGPRVAVVALLVVLFAAIGTYALWRMRPHPPAWHALGADRIQTPGFDIADEATRRAMAMLQSRANVLTGYRGRWLALACAPDPLGRSTDDEIYVLGIEDGGLDRPSSPRRITVALQTGGESTHELFADGLSGPATLSRRTFGEAEAEHFRDLLVDGGYPRMAPARRPAICHGAPAMSLESCVRGRYYGVIRQCEALEGEASLADLAAAIEAFSLATKPGENDP